MPPEPSRVELERRREELAGRVAELHWDLGGLAYEMAIRDHFRNDVLLARAAQLQELDTELAEVERRARRRPRARRGPAERAAPGRRCSRPRRYACCCSSRSSASASRSERPRRARATTSASP